MTANQFYEVSQVPRETITHFQVFGERRSGTNYVNKLIVENVKIDMTTRYGWKHGTITMPCIAPDGLVIAVVRNPITWLSSLHNRPFTKANKNLTFSDFLRTEWYDEYMPRDIGHAKWGYGGMVRAAHVANQIDRHPITGKRFANPLELRAVKTAGFLGLLNREANAVVVSYEYANSQPEEFIARLVEDFQLDRKRDFQRPDRVGPKGSGRPRITLDEMSDEDLSYIHARLDHAQECFLGYLGLTDL